MWPVMPYLSTDASRADAVFALGLQRSDEPSAGQVRQAVAAAIRAFGCSRRQRKPLPRCHVGGLAQQQGLSYPLLSLHQHHTADPLLCAPQQVTDYLPLRLTSAHNLIASISCLRCCFTEGSRWGVTDHRRHAIASREPGVRLAGSRGRKTSSEPAPARGPGSSAEFANASRATARAQRIRITAVSG